jgi:transcriptional regulator with XRE-family HTH domain
MLNVQFIKKTMRGLGLTGKDVGDVCGVTKEAVSNWLEGESHSMRRTNATLIYRRTENLRAVQVLLDHSKLELPVPHLGIEVHDALETSERTET